MKCDERLRELRKKANETQEQTAKAAVLTVRQYQRYESGAQKPGLDNLWALADHFGVSMDYLAGRGEQP